MELYYYETPNPRKAVAVARYLEAPVTLHRVDLVADEQNSPAFRRINPNSKVRSPTTKLREIRRWFPSRR